MQLKVFVSYARPDRDLAKAMVDFLVAREFKVWWDDGITPGESFRDKIEREITESDFLVVLWTTNSVTSAFVRDEAQLAVEQAKLIPVTFDGVRPPPGFMGYQSISCDSAFPDFGLILASLRKGADVSVAAPEHKSDAISANALDDQRIRENCGFFDHLPDPELAEILSRQAVAEQPSVARFHFQLGFALHSQSKHEEACECFLRAASLGHGLAKFYLAGSYEDGKGVAQNSIRAREHYRAALAYFEARRGNKTAERALLFVGVALKDARVIEEWKMQKDQRVDDPWQLLMEAQAEQFSSNSTEREVAFEKLRRASAAGIVAADYELAKALRRADRTDHAIEAAQRYEAVGRLGIPCCFIDAGHLYVRKLQSFDDAQRCFEAAAQLGDMNAEKELGLLHLRKDNPLRDKSLGIEVLEKALAKLPGRERAAHVLLAEAYRAGDGSEVDVSKAIKHFRKAAWYSNPKDVDWFERTWVGHASIALYEIFKFGEATERDMIEALQWLENAAKVFFADSAFQYAVELDEADYADAREVVDWIFKAFFDGRTLSAGVALSSRLRGLPGFSHTFSQRTVVALQKKMRDEGFYSGIIDGYFNDQTAGSVEKYCAAHGKTISIRSQS